MRQAGTVKEVLQAVEWILNNVGWSQGYSFRDREGYMMFPVFEEHYPAIGSVSLGGAFKLVETEPKLKTDAINHFVNSNSLYGLVHFNDAMGRTKEEVLEAVGNAIQRSR